MAITLLFIALDLETYWCLSLSFSRFCLHSNIFPIIDIACFGSCCHTAPSPLISSDTRFSPPSENNLHRFLLTPNATSIDGLQFITHLIYGTISPNNVCPNVEIPWYTTVYAISCRELSNWIAMQYENFGDRSTFNASDISPATATISQRTNNGTQLLLDFFFLSLLLFWLDNERCNVRIWPSTWNDYGIVEKTIRGLFSTYANLFYQFQCD